VPNSGLKLPDAPAGDFVACLKKIRAIRFRFLKPEPIPKALPVPEVGGALYLDPEKTFHDRKIIRKLGGVYDGKRWYVPEGVNLRPFVGWMYEEDATNFLLSQSK
jgi:hypothetical protein